MSKRNTAHIRQCTPEGWEELSDKAKAARIKQLNTVKDKTTEVEEEYWVSKTGDTDIVKRVNKIGKKPSQRKGARSERTRKTPTSLLTDTVMHWGSDSD